MGSAPTDVHIYQNSTYMLEPKGSGVRAFLFALRRERRPTAALSIARLVQHCRGKGKVQKGASNPHSRSAAYSCEDGVTSTRTSIQSTTVTIVPPTAFSRRIVALSVLVLHIRKVWIQL